MDVAISITKDSVVVRIADGAPPEHLAVPRGAIWFVPPAAPTSWVSNPIYEACERAMAEYVPLPPSPPISASETQFPPV